MNAWQWIDAATRDLPAGVSARVRADTLAHLQDAAVPDRQDVRAVLGDPETTADELKRLYLTREEWQRQNPEMTPDKLWWQDLCDLAALLIWPALLLFSLLEPRAPLHGQWWLALLAAAVALLLGATQRLHPTRRRTWRFLSVILAGPLLSLGGLFSPEPLPVLLALALSALIARRLLLTLRDDARLSRTLALEEAQR